MMRPPEWSDATWRLWKISVIQILLLVVIVVGSIVLFITGRT